VQEIEKPVAQADMIANVSALMRELRAAMDEI